MVALGEIRIDVDAFARSHGALERAQFGFELIEVTKRGGCLLRDRVGLVRVDLLAEHSELDLPGPGHCSLVGRLLAAQHPQQRRLAGSVGADESDAIAGLHM